MRRGILFKSRQIEIRDHLPERGDPHDPVFPVFIVKEPGRSGVETDQGADGLSEAELQALDTNDVYFEYAVEYFTNLGSYVASKKGKIYCNDELNPVWYFTQPGAAKPGKCTDAGMERNFFIGWNMLANNGRTVGTGAYIVKLKSFVKMGGYGKKAKQEKTSVWGAKRGLPKGADLMGVLNQILH